MIERPERRSQDRHLVEERVTVSGSGAGGLVVLHGTIVNIAAGGLAIHFGDDVGIDPDFVADVVVTRSTGELRHLVLRVLAIEDRTLRAAFVDPPTIDPLQWQVRTRA